MTPDTEAEVARKRRVLLAHGLDDGSLDWPAPSTPAVIEPEVGQPFYPSRSLTETCELQHRDRPIYQLSGNFYGSARKLAVEPLNDAEWQLLEPLLPQLTAQARVPQRVFMDEVIKFVVCRKKWHDLTEHAATRLRLRRTLPEMWTAISARATQAVRDGDLTVQRNEEIQTACTFVLRWLGRCRRRKPSPARCVANIMGP